MTLLHRQRGVTIPELTLACLMVGLLTTFIFFSYEVGLRGLFKSQAQNELLSQLQVGAKRISGSFTQTAAPSVTYDPANRAISFLTFYDIDGRPQFRSDGAPEWDAYLIFYHDNSDNTLRRRRVDLRGSASQRRSPGPIELYNPGGGRRPLSFYLVQGAPVARRISDFQMTFLPSLGSGFEFVLVGLRPKEGNRAESRSSLKWTSVARN